MIISNLQEKVKPLAKSFDIPVSVVYSDDDRIVSIVHNYSFLPFGL